MMAKEAGYGANQAITKGQLPKGFVQAFDNLAMATATDKTTFKSLSQRINSLQEELS